MNLACPHCRYDLSGHAGLFPIVCPECGHHWTPSILRRALEPSSPWWYLCGLIWSPVLIIALAAAATRFSPRGWFPFVPLAAGFLPAFFFCTLFFAALRVRAGRTPFSWWLAPAAMTMAAAFESLCLLAITRLLPA